MLSLLVGPALGLLWGAWATYHDLQRRSLPFWALAPLPILLLLPAPDPYLPHPWASLLGALLGLALGASLEGHGLRAGDTRALSILGASFGPILLLLSFGLAVALVVFSRLREGPFVPFLFVGSLTSLVILVTLVGGMR